ncbi:hypothetical protein BS17DRAFT_777502 [Gyrodon lividus]|nr:hypothetical protein BS17DRAFT_777502 [Gyrodon lividus]
MYIQVSSTVKFFSQGYVSARRKAKSITLILHSPMPDLYHIYTTAKLFSLGLVGSTYRLDSLPNSSHLPIKHCSATRSVPSIYIPHQRSALQILVVLISSHRSAGCLFVSEILTGHRLLPSMERNDRFVLSNSTPGELLQELASLGPFPIISSTYLSPLPSRTLLEVTPSATTVTLPTPEPVHAQLAGVVCHDPPRFIFYPISWDGYESPPPSVGVDHCSTQNCLDKLDVPADLEVCGDDEWPGAASAASCPEDVFQSIDHWRRNVTKYGGATSELLGPVQDVDTPLSLLSFPHDSSTARSSRSESAAWNPVPFRLTSDSNISDDQIQLWVHQGDAGLASLTRYNGGLFR